MFTMLLAHLVAALVGPLLVRWVGRNGFYPLALVPGASAIWLATIDPRTLADAPREESIPWIPAFGIDIAFRLDALSWVLALIATGIGAIVLLYCARYFQDTEPGLGRFAGVLTAFAGAMVGLVLADDVMVIYTFWELTTVFSYLLIGHYQDKQASRRAALNALISTTAGGLAMLVGLLMVASQAGTMRLSAIVVDPMWEQAGPYLITAMLLLLAGATSKSALLPTHFWLPGAMAAPTPVSAYLHAAAMVKAGVYLILRVAPALTHLEVVTMVLAAFGAATMLVGGWRALRQTDIKLLLAYGTVSQLGFLAAVTGLATHDAVLAGLAMLIAHAVFKAPLFMVVGIIDKKFGTRDLRVLSGVGRVAPVVAVIGTVSAASMAAVPPLYGFVAKESIYSALWYAGGWQRLLLFALVAGSILTVAYSWRFVVGAFGSAPGAPRVEKPQISVLYWLPPAVVAALSVALAFLAAPLEDVLRTYSSMLPEAGEAVHLVIVPHLGIPLLASVVTLGLSECGPCRLFFVQLRIAHPGKIDYGALIPRWHAALHRQQLLVDFVHPAGDLSGYDLVIAPHLYLVSDESAANLTGFVREGGDLLVAAFSDVVDNTDASARAASRSRSAMCSGWRSRSSARSSARGGSGEHQPAIPAEPSAPCAARARITPTSTDRSPPCAVSSSAEGGAAGAGSVGGGARALLLRAPHRRTRPHGEAHGRRACLVPRDDSRRRRNAPITQWAAAESGVSPVLDVPNEMVEVSRRGLCAYLVQLRICSWSRRRRERGGRGACARVFMSDLT